jgi:hypothetical protein
MEKFHCRSVCVERKKAGVARGQREHQIPLAAHPCGPARGMNSTVERRPAILGIPAGEDQVEREWQDQREAVEGYACVMGT